MLNSTHDSGNAWTGRAKLALVVFGAIAGFFLLAEHRAHVLPLLPWVLLAACPLMHVFMHGGHGHGHSDHGGGSDEGPAVSDRQRRSGSSGGAAGGGTQSHGEQP